MDTISLQQNTKEEDLREMLLTAPVWDSPLWESLQTGDYANVERRFAELLRDEFTGDEWMKIYWDGIFSGIPSFRGDVSILSWSTSALPALVRAVLQTATPKNLSIIFHQLPLERVRVLRDLFAQSIPGNDLIQKKVWLQEHNQPLSVFLNTNLAGIALEESSDNILSRQGFSRAQILPNQLLYTLLSAEPAMAIQEIAKDSELNEAQAHQLALLSGAAILGLSKVSDIPSLIQQKCGLPEEKASSVFKIVDEKILQPLKEEIRASAPANPFTQSSSESQTPRPASSDISTPPPETPEMPTPVPTSSPIQPRYSPLPQTPSRNIPPSLAQQPSGSFFKKREETAPAQSSENTSQHTASQPFIIHEETRAQSLSAAPKLGFRVGDNKLTEAEEKPAALRAAELTMAGSSNEKNDAPSPSPKARMSPIQSLGAKFSFSSSTPSPQQPPSPSSTGFLSKISDSLSSQKKESSLPPVPLAPQSNTVGAPLKESLPDSPLEGSSSSTPRTEEKKPESPIPSPLIKNAPLVSTPPPTSPDSQKTTPTPSSPSSPITPIVPKTDLKKTQDVVPKEVPASPKSKKPGLWQRFFGEKSESPSLNLISSSEKTTPLAPSRQDSPKTISSPLPPPPPAPLKTPDLPQSTSVKSTSIPIQKISPLRPIPSNTKDQNPSSSPQAKTIDTISEAPRVVNYSEYPSQEEQKGA